MAAPLTALIVDDEPLARQELQYLLESAGGVDVLALGSNGLEAVDLIREHKPDVIFLDVRMPGLDGFAVLKKVLSEDRAARLPEVVFATAFDKYAVRAFEVNAVDYLLKPFDQKRLQRTIEKVRARRDAPAAATSLAASAAQPDTPRTETAGLPSRMIAAEAKLDALLRMVEEQAAGSTSPARTGKVVVRSGNRMLLVDQRDVCFAAIADGTISVVTRTGQGESNCRTLEDLAEQLEPDQFWRAHRSFLVNIQHIREVMPWFNSSFQLKMDDKDATEIPVSRSQTKRLRELFNL